MKLLRMTQCLTKSGRRKNFAVSWKADEYTIAKKAAMMVEHFHEQVIAKGKIGGQARAMVVTSSIPRCVEYYMPLTSALLKGTAPIKQSLPFQVSINIRGRSQRLLLQS